MSRKFKPGDRVRRIQNFTKNCPKGTEIIVDTYLENHPEWLFSCREGLLSAGGSNRWDDRNFELVPEVAKPWLKITPPQPEKRELINADLFGNFSIKFYDEKTAKLWIGSNFTRTVSKYELAKLGETLIEISKEMEG